MYYKQIHFLRHWLAYNMYLYKTHTTTYVTYDKQIHFWSHWLAYNMYLYKTQNVFVKFDGHGSNKVQIIATSKSK